MLNVSLRTSAPLSSPPRVNFGTLCAVHKFPCDSFALNSDFISESTVKTKCGNIKLFKVPVEIHKVVNSKGEMETYYIKEKNKENILGEMTIKIDDPTIFIMNLESYGRRTYSGIGSRLIQIALEKSMEYNHNNRVELSAQKLHLIQHSPVAFYERMGFLPTQQDAFEENLYGKNMYLSLSQEPRWLEQIVKHPLLHHS